MVQTFNVKQLPTVEFGGGAVQKLPTILKQFNGTTLFIFGEKSFQSSETFANLKFLLKKEKLSYFYDNIKGEPSPEEVDSIVSKYKNVNLKSICSIGGGSVIDAGKAVAAMLTEGLTIQNYLEDVGTLKPTGTTLPFIAVPTTSGTGSEATKNSVITKHGSVCFKKSLRHDNFIPKFAIIDPNLTLTLPSTITAFTGMDALSQLIESYISIGSNRFTDTLALDGIKLISNSIQQLCTNEPDNLILRSNMSYAAYLSGITLAHAGLCTVHGSASVIGSYYKIPHGFICGKLLSIWTEKCIRKSINIGDNNTLQKFANISKCIFHHKLSKNEEAAEQLIFFLKNLTENLLKDSFSKYGMKLNDVDKFISECSNKNNPIKFSKNEIKDIITEAI